MTTDTVDLVGQAQTVEAQGEAVEAPTPTQELHFLVEWLGSLFTGGMGVETFDGDEGSVDEFLNKVDERVAAGDFNNRTAFLFLDLFLGGLLIPDADRLKELAGRGARLNIKQMLDDISLGDAVFSKVQEKRDFYGKAAHVPS